MFISRLSCCAFLMVWFICVNGESKPKLNNSKFLDPQLDEEENLIVASQDYDIDFPIYESNGTQERIAKRSSENSQMSSKQNQEKNYTMKPKKFGISNFLVPVLSITGVTNGGLYGAQYYGLTSQYTSGWRMPSLAYPFYGHKYTKTKNEPRNIPNINADQTH